MEVPRLRVKSELWPPAYGIATAMPDTSRICDLHHSSQQCQILNPLSEARDCTCILMDTSWILNLLSHNRNSLDSCFSSLCTGPSANISLTQISHMATVRIKRHRNRP